MAKSLPSRIFAGVAFGLLLVTGAYAHHGWSWAEADQVELSGTIREISMAPPHPTLQVETRNDGTWRVELGNPRLTERSGFVEGAAKAGDPIVVLGNRSLDRNEKRMKAVRITVAGKVYDIYPERIRTN
ncbi:hypothetical protein HR059_03635 [Sinorhizobium meliloti WSM1022]|jgi:hypothetical protein|uniref:Uncharacterized protein n=5 Tax=Sinorhizobium TaxID=28105 RepID=Q92RD9_RHIME|nr:MULTISPECIES: DUF6152 family protein [Sinorhizobium]PST28387.1 hypothetical protein C7U62_06960 [Mesorhizobium loti]TWB02539.1 hypothetical protein FB000_1069 [Ensifer sp. SEMIA 134]TWB36773.1 hypothetical protein FB001_106219 [Ensifer sp. SEMIA 135]AEG03498.1 hypothetical protein SinmeB_0559 [Sinorhizobium meliloti BL225C]AEG52414.1 hypothetical protein Sinme_0655 [Sinorhizobium meliloti AK83]